MKIAITGSLGLLGQRIVKYAPPTAELLCVDLPESPAPLPQANYQSCDLTNRKKVQGIIESFSPDWIINCAAFTNVDKAEQEKEMCWNVNVEAVKNIIYAARKTDCRILQLSTDYVFNGKAGPYSELDPPDPIGFYGKSKLAAENELRGAPIESTIIRTMVLYGISDNHRPDFVNWLIKELSAGRDVRIVTDQIGNSTLNDNLANNIWKVIDQQYTGILNIAGREINSRLDFALQIAEVFDLNPDLIHATRTEELGQKAPRPLNSGLIVDKAVNELGLACSDNYENLLYLKTLLNSNN